MVAVVSLFAILSVSPDQATVLRGSELPFPAYQPNASQLYQSIAALDCPRTCLCNSLSRIVYCSRRGMVVLPRLLPPGTLQLNVNGNAFLSLTLRRSNFSGYSDRSLEHLYMSECGLEEIEAGAFLDLTNLKWLDLSNNNIRLLRKETFKGTRLEHLFLNGNRQIILLPETFQNMATTGLYLHDCSLASFPLETIRPLAGSLRYLWLNGNKLERLDRRLSEVFSSLFHLRIGSNPLLCNCEALWLKDFYDKNIEVFRGAIAPSCAWPPSLRARQFTGLTIDEFRCRVPMFRRIEASFNDSQIALQCSAVGDPAPSLYWIQPSGTASRFNPPKDMDARENEGILLVGSPSDFKTKRGMYICIANNDAGNVTLTLDLPQMPVMSKQTLIVSDVYGKDQQGHTMDKIEKELNTRNTYIRSEQANRTNTVSNLNNTWQPEAKRIFTPAPSERWMENDGSSDGRFDRDDQWDGGIDGVETKFHIPVTQSSHLPSSIDPFQSTDVSENFSEAFLGGGSDPVRAAETVCRNFSLSELLGAILATHLFTVACCLCVTWICYKRKCLSSGKYQNKEAKSSPEFTYWSGKNAGPLRFVDYTASSNVSPLYAINNRFKS